MMRYLAMISMLAAATASAQTAPAVSATPIPAAVPEKIICRSTLETGSLVKKHKTCLTSKQWRYVTDVSSADARRIVDDNAGRPSCNDAATC